MSESKPKPVKCPTCKKIVPSEGPEAKSYPFCSPRCKTIDLAKWASGEYVISRPIEQRDLEEDE